MTIIYRKTYAMNNNSKNAQFLRLYTSIQPKLFSFLLAVVHSRAEAEELFQDTAVVLWEKYDKYDPKSDFGAWAIGIARNKVFEYLRKNKKTKKVFNTMFYDQISDLATNSSDDISDRITMLKSCVNKLSPSDKVLLTSRYNEKKSVRQLSQLTGRPTNSLYKSLARIIILLRQCITRQMRNRAIS